MMDTDRIKVCVVGGGAAGMMAAGTALSFGAEVYLYEHMPILGKKLAITGKGRCNITNSTGIQGLLDNIPRNPRFLYSAFNAFTPDDTIAFFEGLGVPTKVERGNRVFPVSDSARDVVNALRRYCEGVTIVYEKVKKIKCLDDGGFSVITSSGEKIFDKVILATGGKSYPGTGSDGSGYRLAMGLSHHVTELTPSLIPIETDSKYPPMLQGLALKNVAIKVLDPSDNCLYTDFGEMLFAHFGVTGPIVLSASAHLRGVDISTLTLSIDLKPALDEKTLDARLLSDFRENANRDLINSLGQLLPSKLISPFIEMCGIDPRRKVNSITKEERLIILRTLKDMRVPLSSFRPIEEAIITSGGVDVKEIKASTMESKLHEGLFFAGEIIDVDAYTGGFNLQIAFSTGYLAGKNAAEYFY